MNGRFTDEQLGTWRRDGGVLLPRFFTAEEVAAVCADFETMFAGRRGATAPLVRRGGDAPGQFSSVQTSSIRLTLCRWSVRLRSI